MRRGIFHISHPPQPPPQFVSMTLSVSVGGILAAKSNALRMHKERGGGRTILVFEEW